MNATWSEMDSILSKLIKTIIRPNGPSPEVANCFCNRNNSLCLCAYKYKNMNTSQRGVKTIVPFNMAYHKTRNTCRLPRACYRKAMTNEFQYISLHPIQSLISLVKGLEMRVLQPFASKFAILLFPRAN